MSPVQRLPDVKAQAVDSADPLSRAGYLFVLIAVPLVTCNALRIGENLTYGDVPLALAALLLLAAWLRHGHPRGAVPLGVVVGALLLLGTGLVSSIAAATVDSLTTMLRFAVTLAAMPLIIMFAASTPHRLQRLIDMWLVAAGANAAVGALDLLGITDVGTSLTNIDFVTFTDRATGLTSHPNHLGLVAAMALPVAVARLGWGGLRGLAAIALVPLLFVGVVESGSRGAFLAAAGGIVIFLLLGVTCRNPRVTLLLLAAPVATFVILVSILGTNELTGSIVVERLGGGGGAALSDNFRRQTLQDSIEQASDHLIVGEGFTVVRTAHNIYLQLLQAGGILALTGFVAYAGAIVRRARWLALPRNSPWLWQASIAAANGASVCVWLLFGMVGNAIYDRYLYLPVGLTLAVALISKRMRVAADDPPATPARLQDGLRTEGSPARANRRMAIK
jgi:O-antigen ligase